MLASVHPQTAATKILFTLDQSIALDEADDILGVLIDQQGQISSKRVAIQGHKTASLYEEPVTWEDAEWQ